MNIIVNYELFGYLAIIFNLISFSRKSKKELLIYIIIAGIFMILNMNLLKFPFESIYITSLGLSLSIISFFLLNYEKERKMFIKISPLIAFYIVYIYDFSFVGLISGLGFFFATIAKLQNNIIKMKILFLFSATTWLILMIYLTCYSLILYDLIGIIILLYSLTKELKKKYNKK